MGCALSCRCLVDYDGVVLKTVPAPGVTAVVSKSEPVQLVSATPKQPEQEEIVQAQVVKPVSSAPPGTAPSNVRQLPPIYDGLSIVVQGNIFPNANGFAVNLCAGPNYGQCDTALHFNPRYDQGNIVVRNSFLNGSWGPEERDGPQFHVPQGSVVECIMLVQNDVIKVAFNGQHYCEYRHRMQKERITHIVVSGDMQLTNLAFFGAAAPPAGMYSGYSGAAGGGYNYPVAGASTAPGAYPPPLAVYHPGGPAALPVPAGYPTPDVYGQQMPGSLPNKEYVPGGLFPGRMIFITATPGPSQFAVNLRHQAEGGDIAFHFNPRLSDAVVVRNSCLGDAWGDEERDQPSFPFQAGQQFNMIILCEPDEFKVAVNNQHFIEFKSRTGNLQAIQWVEVVADATVSNIFVQ